MGALHYTVNLNTQESVKVELDDEARICLLDEENFQRFKARQRYRYIGRSKERREVVIRPNSPGEWHVVIMGGKSSLKALVSVI